MHPAEREKRLQSVSDLLFALKVSGCSQRFVSAYLKVSNSTLSHWKRANEDKSRKVGIPSDEQLAKLVGLWRYQFISNFTHALGCYDDAGGTRREGVLLLHAMGSALRDAAGYLELRTRRHDELVAKTRAIIALVGREDAKRLLSPVAFGRWEGDPDPTEAEWEEAYAKSNAEAEQALAAVEVTEADMARTRGDLDAWVKEQRDRLKRETLERIERREQEKQKKSDPD